MRKFLAAAFFATLAVVSVADSAPTQTSPPAAVTGCVTDAECWNQITILDVICANAYGYDLYDADWNANYDPKDCGYDY